MFLKGNFCVISIHTFLAEGDIESGIYSIAPTVISIHTFLAEGDLYAMSFAYIEYISIHTFLAEGDLDNEFMDLEDDNFNPHLPRGR